MRSPSRRREAPSRGRPGTARRGCRCADRASATRSPHIPVRHEPVAPVDDIGHHPHWGRDHGDTCGERLKEDQTARLVRARQCQNISGPKKGDDVGVCTGEPHALRVTRLFGRGTCVGNHSGCAADHEQHDLGGHQTQCIDDQRQALALELVADEERDILVVRITQRGARCPSFVCARWAKAV